MANLAFDPMLAAYQGEIDNLTKRSKISESAFLSLYKLLAEAPDPFPLLDAAVVSTHLKPLIPHMLSPTRHRRRANCCLRLYCSGPNRARVRGAITRE